MSKPSKIKNGTGGKNEQQDMNNQLLMGMFQAQQEIINRLHQHEIFIASLQELLVENETLTEDDLKGRIEKLSNELKKQLEDRQKEMEKEREDKRKKIIVPPEDREGLEKQISDLQEKSVEREKEDGILD